MLFETLFHFLDMNFMYHRLPFIGCNSYDHFILSKYPLFISEFPTYQPIDNKLPYHVIRQQMCSEEALFTRNFIF